MAAMPERVKTRSKIDLVTDAIWAFVHRDISRLLTVLAPDFTYTDLHLGGSLASSAHAVTALLVAHSDLQDRGLAELEVHELDADIVEASGVLTREEPGGETSHWRWSVTSGVAGGRIAWAVRRADEPLDR